MLRLVAALRRALCPARSACATLALGLAALLPPRAAAAARPPVYPSWNVELRLTPYRPTLSRNAEVAALREILYDRGDKSLFKGRPLMFGAELSYHPYREFGLLGPLLQVGYWTQSAPGRKCTEGDQVVLCTPALIAQSVAGSDTASLTVLPVSVGAVYRLDLLRRQYAVPVTFHAKAGLTYFLWWSALGGNTATYRGRHARGGSLGAFGAVGVSLALDGLGRRGGATTYGSSGKDSQTAALFAEYSFIRGRDLIHDAARRLDFSDNVAVTVGLQIAFR